MKRGILDYMTRHGFETINDMKGIILDKLVSMEQNISVYGRTKGLILPEVDRALCTL